MVTMVLPDLKESEGKVPVSFVPPDMPKQSLDAGVQNVMLKLSDHLMVEIPQFSGGPGETYLKVIKMVDGLLAK